MTAVYVAQTQSSQAVNIQARVSGFLDKRVYLEGSVVKAGQVLFQMDPKPFQAQVDAAQAAMQRNQAALEVAKANLARTKPLAQQNALSQKDLDDAQGPVRAVGGRRRAGEGAADGGAAQPVVHDDPLAGRRRVQLRGRRRRHVPQSAELAADHGVGAVADVDQLQHLGKRDGARPRRRPQAATSSFRRAASSRSRSRWSTARCSRTPAASRSPTRRTTRRRARSCCARPSATRPACSGRTSTCACGSRARSIRTRSSCRSARSSKAPRATSSGSSTSRTRPSCAR